MTVRLFKSRRKTHAIQVGSVAVGGDAPISIQSMTTSKTHDVDATVIQISELAIAGCDIIRVGVPQQKDVEALPAIVERSPVPVVADIHFQPQFVLRAIEAGCGGVRVNPGNIRNFSENAPKIIDAAKANQVSLRIGVNAGSLDPSITNSKGLSTYLPVISGNDIVSSSLRKHEQLACGEGVEGKEHNEKRSWSRKSPEAAFERQKINADMLVASAIKEARMFEELDFYDFKISIKHHNPLVVIEAYRKLAELGNWPLHLGVTEAGLKDIGIIKSSAALSILLSEGIGDTIRISLTDDPIEEVKAGCKLLEVLGLRQKTLDIVSCPTCARTNVNVIELTKRVATALEGVQAPLTVAVMGCEVNGPGEAREADLGVAAGNGVGRLFVKGQVVKSVPEAEIVQTLVTEVKRLVTSRQ